MISRQDIEYGREDLKQKKGRCVEILAPAGSYDSFRAALMAGADAVYAGGPHFGARAYAENFTEEQLLEAIEEAHLHGRRFYLTVNTLVKDRELPSLRTYLEPLYRGGLDAVIVQDTGVLELVRSTFPGMDLHVSTQMTITGTGGAQFLKECGAVRVVPARELSLEEIRHMKRDTGMEIECFVHGALCYCYSGQCLLSSMIGGRSGNRGQCAQPCRLRYGSGGKKGYLLSLKDICTLELIPDLIEAGIDSFKIEGRMKRPEYVAGVTAMYRKYTDLYLESGRGQFHVSEKDKEMLLDLYNRGGFHTGYYQQRNGRDMIAIDRPNHAGVPAAKVTGQKGREVFAEALTEIHKGDVLAFPRQGDHTFGQDHEKGSMLTIPVAKGKHLETGAVLYRIRNERLIQGLQESWKQGRLQENIHGYLRMAAQEPARLTVRFGDISAEAVSGLVVERAEKSPLDEARIRKNLEKTGNTEFVFETLEIELEEGVFLPMQQINELRRQALAELRQNICSASRREGASSELRIPQRERETENTGKGAVMLSALAASMPQLEEICGYLEIARVYVESGIGDTLPEVGQLAEICRQLQSQGREVYLAAPHIFRERTKKVWEQGWNKVSGIPFDGILLRNYESLAFFRDHPAEKSGGEGRGTGFDKNLILDHNLYVMNQAAKTFWNRRGVYEFTVPLELNRGEIGHLDAKHMEMLVYGYLPVMVTAQCMAKTVDRCQMQPGKTGSRPAGEFLAARGIRKLTDRYGNPFYVENRCRDCYNIIYNPVGLCLFDEKEALEELCPSRLRLQFSVEDRQETRQVLLECRRVFLEGKEPAWQGKSFTRGHFRRGIL